MEKFEVRDATFGWIIDYWEKAKGTQEVFTEGDELRQRLHDLVDELVRE